MRNYPQLYAILNKNGLTKEEAVSEFTDGRTQKASDLSDSEFADLMRRLQDMNPVPPGDRQRKKMISLARQMQYGKTTRAIIKKIDEWSIKQKYGKTLMQLDLDQLNKTLYIFEHHVYADYMTGLNK